MPSSNKIRERTRQFRFLIGNSQYDRLKVQSKLYTDNAGFEISMSNLCRLGISIVLEIEYEEVLKRVIT